MARLRALSPLALNGRLAGATGIILGSGVFAWQVYKVKELNSETSKRSNDELRSKTAKSQVYSREPEIISLPWALEERLKLQGEFLKFDIFKTIFP